MHSPYHQTEILGFLKANCKIEWFKLKPNIIKVTDKNKAVIATVSPFIVDTLIEHNHVQLIDDKYTQRIELL